MTEYDANGDRINSGSQASDDATPDSLMEQFKGQGLKPILIFTVVVHVVLILGSSIPFFVRTITGGSAAKRPEAERLESAVEDATSAIRKIAKKHGLNPQVVSDQFTGGGSRTSKATDAATPDAAADDSASGPETDEPGRVKSAYETNLEVQVQGPSVPSFEDDSDDIF
jgi:hypothetical protein